MDKIKNNYYLESRVKKNKWKIDDEKKYHKNSPSILLLFVIIGAGHTV